MRLKLLLAYVGTRYCGWQIQQGRADQPTVQAAVEAALSRLCGRPVRAVGAGRTDAGVHAHGQVAHCDVPDSRAALDWRRACNSRMPPDIRVLHACPAPPDFHARNHALRKTYVYQFWTERAFTPPELLPFVWPCGPLDTQAMRDALPHLLGRRDFASLRNRGTEVDSTIRTLEAADLTPMPPLPYYPPHAPALRLTVTGDGFLKQMVRNMAGLLADCGRGKIRPAAIPAVLAARDRQALPAPTAPAQGLALARVEYAPRIS